MIAKDKSINAWQTGIILFVLLFANKFLLLPSLLVEDLKMEAFFVPLILGIAEFCLLIVFYRLKVKYPDQSFFDLIESHLGKVFAYFVYTLLAIYFVSKAILLYNIVYIFFKSVLYKSNSNYLFLFCIIPIINYFACSGLRTMGRTLQLFFPVLLLLTVFCIVVGIFGISGKPLFFQSSAGDVTISALRHISTFGDTLFLFVIMDKVKIEKKQWKVVFSLSATAIALVVAITGVFMLCYTYTSFMHPFALYELMSHVREYGGTGRIDILSMVLIIIFAYFHLSLYLKGFMCSFNEIFRKINPIYSVLSFNIAFLLLITYVVLNLENAIYYGENVLPYGAVLPFIIIPIVSCVCCSSKKRRGKNE